MFPFPIGHANVIQVAEPPPFLVILRAVAVAPNLDAVAADAVFQLFQEVVGLNISAYPVPALR